MRARSTALKSEVGAAAELSFLGMRVAYAARNWRTRGAIALAALAFSLANVVCASAEPAPGLFASPADLPAAAGTAPSLGTAQAFAVLGGSAVTNTGPTTITGNVGLSPGSAVTGFPPGLVTGGTIHAADAVALQAQNPATDSTGRHAAAGAASTTRSDTDEAPGHG